MVSRTRISPPFLQPHEVALDSLADRMSTEGFNRGVSTHFFFVEADPMVGKNFASEFWALCLSVRAPRCFVFVKFCSCSIFFRLLLPYDLPSLSIYSRAFVLAVWRGYVMLC